MADPTGDARTGFLRTIYNNPLAPLPSDCTFSKGFCAAIDFVRFVGRLRMSRDVLPPDLHWVALLRSVEDIASSVIRGVQHPFFDQQRDAVGRGRPGPTLSEFESYVALTDIVRTLACHRKETPAGRRGGASKLGVYKARLLLTERLAHLGYSVNADQLKYWEEVVHAKIGEASAEEKAAFRKRQDGAKQQFQKMPQAELVAEAVGFLRRAQSVAEFQLQKIGKL